MILGAQSEVHELVGSDRFLHVQAWLGRGLARAAAQRGRTERSPIDSRNSDDHHNPRLSTSWRDVTSHPPSRIPCFDGTVNIQHNTYLLLKAGAGDGLDVIERDVELRTPHGCVTRSSTYLASPRRRCAATRD
jgi:hypothetical protein